MSKPRKVRPRRQHESAVAIGGDSGRVCSQSHSGEKSDIGSSARNIYWFHDNSSTDISSTTLRLQTFRLQTFRLQTFRLLLYTSVQDSYTSNFRFSKSLFSSIPTSTYTMIPFYQSHFH